MIDLHCHILPGVDDGPDNIAESLEMAQAAVYSGITHVLCTPHHNNGRFENPKEQVLEKLTLFQKQLEVSGIPLTVFGGQEVRITGNILEKLTADELLTVDLEGRYLLIEFPTTDVPAYTEALFIKLLAEGVIPIIVHPERNQVFGEDPNRLIPYLDMGCLAQLTAPSYVGVFGKKIEKTAKNMVAHGLVQMVGSDAHGGTKRPFFLAEAMELIGKDFGDELVSEMKQVSRDILNGELVVAEGYQEIRSKRFGFWRK